MKKVENQLPTTSFAFFLKSGVKFRNGVDEMLKGNQKVKVKLNPRNINRYKELGYRGKKNDEIEVDVKHLTKGCNNEVLVICDYCGIKEFTRMYSSHYNSSLKEYLKDCCEDCTHLRRSKITLNANRIDYESVKSEFIKRDYILLTSDFGDEAVTNVKLEYLCKKHLYLGSLFINWNHFYSKGQGCRKCSTESNLRWKGENNPSWKGGISDENNRERHSNEYKKWVNQVYIRDNYTCKCCGRVGGELRSHHIQPFSKNKEKRYDVSNGLTLCRECHDVDVIGSFHNTFGTVNFSDRNLVEYLLNNTNKSIEDIKRNIPQLEYIDYL